MEVATCVMLHTDIFVLQGNLISSCTEQKTLTTHVLIDPSHCDHTSHFFLHKCVHIKDSEVQQSVFLGKAYEVFPAVINWR